MGKGRQGKLIIFSAPSGAGKTTIVHSLLKEEKDLAFSVSACSREKRAGEVDAKDYYFLSIEEFKQKIKENAFLEWEEVYKDNYYGTLKEEVQRIWDEGKDVVFDIDVKGGINLKQKFPSNTLSIFIMPPSVEEIENRLRKRHTDTEESIIKRMAKTKEEMTFAAYFDQIVVNDDLDEAIGETQTLIKAFREKTI
jgi:guanylate kinase